jgi:hypothetical protein
MATGERPGQDPEELTTETDQDGKFEFRHLRFTSYWLGAQKEDEAYGDSQVVDLQGGVKLTNPDGVKLTSAMPAARMTLKLKPKWGILSGTVKDRMTHMPIVAVVRLIELVSSSDGRHCFHGFFGKPAPGAFRVLVPPWPDDLFVEVYADGYRPWFYPAATEQSSLPIRIEPGEKKSLEIELERETKDHPDGVRP